MNLNRSALDLWVGIFVAVGIAAILFLALKVGNLISFAAAPGYRLEAHFDTKQIMEISFTVGLDQLISRFHATVRTDVDGVTTDAVNACAVPIPDQPER